MILAGVQPSFLPWLGYFEQIHRADVFIFFDELQYEKYSWRNRNKIKTWDRWMWLIVPVVSANLRNTVIRDVRIDYRRNWRGKHWRSLLHHYSNTPFFDSYRDYFAELYQKKWDHLSALDIETTRRLCEFLGIKTRLVVSSELELESKFRKAHPDGDATDRIVFCCKELGVDVFYEGWAGKNYIREEQFSAESIKLVYQNYQHPVYTQRGGNFLPYMSVIDLLFNHGGTESLRILSAGDHAVPAGALPAGG